jgi:6-phosphofructokinase
MKINKIGITTGGGDAPGLNAVIRAAVLSSLGRGWECVGIRDGYNGLLERGRYPESGLIRLERESVSGHHPSGVHNPGNDKSGQSISLPHTKFQRYIFRG